MNDNHHKGTETRSTLLGVGILTTSQDLCLCVFVVLCFHRMSEIWSRTMSRHLATVTLIALSLGQIGLGEVSDPQIMTDHPVYRGELSCSTLDRTIEDAYRVFRERYGRRPANETEKLTALWIWQCEHHMHNLDPYVFGGQGHPDARERGWMETRDHGLGQFSFGFALCYSIHAQFGALVGYALGDLKKTNCTGVPGHTSFEAFVDGKWVLADMTTGMMVFDDSGTPMSIREIIPFVKDGGEKERIWTSDPRRSGWGQFRVTPFGDNWDVYKAIRGDRKLYGYNALPIVYDLRPGESFTRFLDPGLEDGKKWLFWGADYYRHDAKKQHGPYRNVTFLDDPPIGGNREGQGHARYGNGIFEYEPTLKDDSFREGLWREATSPEVAFKEGALRAASGSAELVFEHRSPYVIAARPARGGDRVWDIRKEECLDGALVQGRTSGRVRLAISLDAGQSWQHIGSVLRDFEIDFTDLVKGRHFYLIRFALENDSGLERFKLRTVTQLARAVFPRLKPGGTRVTYQSSRQSGIHGGPSIDLAERFRTSDDDPSHRVYRIEAPGPIRHVAGVARCQGEGPSPWGPWSIETSLDSGQTWKDAAPSLTLNEQESDWGGGRNAYIWANLDLPGNRSESVLVRFGKGDILAAEVYATYETASASPLTVTYGWLEDGKPRNHSHFIPAGSTADNWNVPTGREVARQWVRFEAE